MPLSSEKIIILDTTGSSNNYAMGLVQNGQAVHGTSVFAIEQTAGKGRLGKAWISDAGSNIVLSVITDMERVSINDRFLLSMAASLSALHLIENNTELEAFVKWPNDIFVNDRKAAGILVENVIRGTIWQWCVTGFGLNVNQQHFPAGLKATSLSIETKQEFDVLSLAKSLRDHFLLEIEGLRRGAGNQIAERYNRKLYKKNQMVKLQVGNRVFEALVCRVTQEGKLVTGDHMQTEWSPDEARMIL